jgi:hypothetical protein
MGRGLGLGFGRLHSRPPLADVPVMTSEAETIDLTVTIASGSVTIYWGDGTSDAYTGAATPSHTYTDGLDSHQIRFAGALNQITKLYCYSNSITALGAGFAQMTALTELKPYNNQITNVSPLSGLTGLTILDLYNNQITNVSPLSGLTGLTYLRLNNNQITTFGTTLTALLSLGILHLQNNGLSQALVDQCLDDIADTIGSRPVSATFKINGSNAAPSEDGCDDFDTIVAHGWDVYVTGNCE